jgi:hypothetical protein
MNKHTSQAEQVYALGETGANLDVRQQSTVAAMAQAQATLALAYEQRTANLIALFGKTHPNGAGAFPHPMLEAAQREIQERLGF